MAASSAAASSTGSYKAVLLVSTVCLDALQDQDQRRCGDLFAAKRVTHVSIDGSDPEHFQLRDQLFGLSGHRGIYPQVFIERFGKYEFIGLWHDIENMNECQDLPPEILKKHPEIRTFEMVFGGLTQQR